MVCLKTHKYILLQHNEVVMLIPFEPWYPHRDFMSLPFVAAYFVAGHILSPATAHVVVSRQSKTFNLDMTIMVMIIIMMIIIIFRPIVIETFRLDFC